LRFELCQRNRKGCEGLWFGHLELANPAMLWFVEGHEAGLG
jgi:hypothetical protein